MRLGDKMRRSKTIGDPSRPTSANKCSRPGKRQAPRIVNKSIEPLLSHLGGIASLHAPDHRQVGGTMCTQNDANDGGTARR